METMGDYILDDEMQIDAARPLAPAEAPAAAATSPSPPIVAPSLQLALSVDPLGTNGSDSSQIHAGVPLASLKASPESRRHSPTPTSNAANAVAAVVTTAAATAPQPPPQPLTLPPMLSVPVPEKLVSALPPPPQSLPLPLLLPLPQAKPAVSIATIIVTTTSSSVKLQEKEDDRQSGTKRPLSPNSSNGGSSNNLLSASIGDLEDFILTGIEDGTGINIPSVAGQGITVGLAVGAEESALPSEAAEAVQSPSANSRKRVRRFCSSRACFSFNPSYPSLTHPPPFFLSPLFCTGSLAPTQSPASWCGLSERPGSASTRRRRCAAWPPGSP